MEVVRFSDLASKEIVDYGNGKCLGRFADCDIRVDPATGKIVELILSMRSGLATLFLDSTSLHVIPWQSIVKIGVDTIIVSLEKQKK